MPLDLMLFLIAGISFLIALVLLIFYLRSRPKAKFITIEDLGVERTKTMRHTATDDLWQPTAVMEITATDATELMGSGESYYAEQMLSGRVLNGLYRIDRVLGRGGMSIVYLCTNLKVGNQWIVKHIYHQANQVLAEENILKRLNHINLPRIIDVFHDEAGTYIVESYIEGLGMDQIINQNELVSEEQIVDWANQLGEVLAYLHNLKPTPIIHRDLKPSNIIVTRENKLVLIDFGISKQDISRQDALIAVSKQYAAPEQFQGSSDERSDIYSFGVILFQLATRHLPNMPNYEALLRDSISREIAEIILKCLQKAPEDRYAQVEELQEDIEHLKHSGIRNIKYIIKRKIALGIAAVFMLVAVGVGAGAVHEYKQMNLSVINVSPEVIYMTEQQTGDIYINQVLPNGEITTLNNDYITWEYSDLHVARVENNKIIAMNVGSTEIIGRYRNKVLQMKVEVVKPDGLTEVKLKYDNNFRVSTYAGNGQNDLQDGALKEAGMVNPSSIDIADDGTVYFADGAYLRQVSEGAITTMIIELAYITPKIVEAISQEEMYYITNEWEDEDGYFSGIVRLAAEGMEGLYIVSAMEKTLLDMDFDQNGDMFVIEQDVLSQKNYILHFPRDTFEPEVLTEVSYGVCSLTFDQDGNLYLADSENAVIYKYNEEKNSCDYFAGLKGERNFIDGINARFYQPTRIKAFADYIYVIDFNVLRRIAIEQGNAFDVETIAGQAGLVEADALEGMGYEVVFGKSALLDMTIDPEGNILLSDPVNNIIRLIKYQERTKPERPNIV